MMACMKCICGHEEEDHRYSRGQESGWCLTKAARGNNRDFCNCEEFEPVEKARLAGGIDGLRA